MNPCEVGFVCPYRGYDLDSDMVCTFPVFVLNTDENTLCVLTSECDCPCLPADSPLQAILNAYSSSVSVRNAIRRENDRLESIVDGILAEIRDIGAED